LSAARAATATFTAAPPVSYIVTRSYSGTGLGTTSPAAGNEEVASGATATTTQAPLTGSTFTGWSGTCGCTGTGACAPTITENCTIVASWSLDTQYLLTVSIPANGATVTSDVYGINCTTTPDPPSDQVCTVYVLSGETVTLSTACATYWYGATYSGDCSGSTCALVMGADKTVGVSCTNGRAATLGAGATVTIGTGSGVITVAE
jgi:hypothetical protein